MTQHDADERVQLNVRVPSGLVEQVRVVAAIDGVRLQDLAIEGLEAVVEARYGDAEWMEAFEGRFRRDPRVT